MFLQRCAFGQGKEEHGGPSCAHCVWIEAPWKHSRNEIWQQNVTCVSVSETTPKTSFEEITWDAEDQGNHNSVLSEVSQLCQSVTSKNWNPSCNNIFPPRHNANDAFLRFTHLASPNCFQASAGILSHQSKSRSFRFQDKRSSQRQSHVTTQNVPPALRIWPRKGGARRPHLRPLCLNRSTFKTGRTQSAFRCWNIFSKWNSDSKVSCCITQWKFETTQQNNRTSFTWDM